ncbi:hypothetical protein Tco_0500641 [Tanacetum coccineum]
MSTSSSTQAVSSDVAELKDMVRALILDRKNQTPASAPVKAVEQSCQITSIYFSVTELLPVTTTVTNPKERFTRYHYPKMCYHPRTGKQLNHDAEVTNDTNPPAKNMKPPRRPNLNACSNSVRLNPNHPEPNFAPYLKHQYHFHQE